MEPENGTRGGQPKRLNNSTSISEGVKAFSDLTITVTDIVDSKVLDKKLYDLQLCGMLL